MNTTQNLTATLTAEAARIARIRARADELLTEATNLDALAWACVMQGNQNVQVLRNGAEKCRQDAARALATANELAG